MRGHLSVGGNDLGFSDIVKFCLRRKRCWRERIVPKRPWSNPGKNDPVLDDLVDRELEKLPSSYADLAAALSGVVENDRVVIVEYFDPTRGARGEDCSMLGRLEPAESRWAREQVLVALNASVRDAADEHHWKLVEDVDEAFRLHGVCAKEQTWVLTLGAASVRDLFATAVGASDLKSLFQSTNGTLHPNEEGHRATAIRIAPMLADVLGVDPPG
jgi:hypothetical protein